MNARTTQDRSRAAPRPAPALGGQRDDGRRRPRRPVRLGRRRARLRHGRAARRALRALLACGVPMVPVVAARRQGPPQPDDRDRLGRAAAAAAGDRSTSASPRSPACGESGRRSAPLLHRPLVLGRATICFAMQVLGVAVVPLLVLSIPYVLWLDRRLIEPRDGAWHFGQLLIGRGEPRRPRRAPRFLPRPGRSRASSSPS